MNPFLYCIEILRRLGAEFIKPENLTFSSIVVVICLAFYVLFYKKWHLGRTSIF